MNMPSPATLLLFICSCVSLSTTNPLRDELKIKFQLEEETPPQSYVGDVLYQLKTIQSDDPNSIFRSNENFKFVLLDSLHSKLFSIEYSKGILKTVQRIDREGICPITTIQTSLSDEELCVVNLKVIVSTSTQTNNFIIVNVDVIVSDINDHTPTFNSNVLDLSILENAPLGSKFSIPSAVDIDCRQNSVRLYELLNASNGPFSLVLDKLDYTDKISTIQDNLRLSDNSLLLKLEKHLDRESLESIQLTIIAVDGGISPRTGTLVINVKVEDVNDNIPIFEHRVYNVSLDEETYYRGPVLKVQATDADEGLNGKVTYQISHQTRMLYDSLFKLNVETGELILKNKLDFESRSTYTLEIVAKDSGAVQFTDLAIIHVTVNDLNDNSPKISLTSADENQASNKITVSENLEHPYTFAFISVTDSDLGLNGECACKLGNSYGIFDLKPLHDNIYSLETRMKLDREKTPSHRVGIICWDRGSPSLNSTLEFDIEISDQNDNGPYFVDHPFKTQVEENTEANTIIMQISAYDIDAGINGNVRYRIENDTISILNYVFIDDATGVLKTGDRQFDYEDMKHLNFNIVAFDMGSPSLSAITEVSIEVLDSNDQPPIFFEDSLKYKVFENQTIGVLISTIETSDSDENSMFRKTKYRLSCCEDDDDEDDEDDGDESLCYVEKSNAKNVVIYNENNSKEHFSSNDLSKLLTMNELTGELRSNTVFDRETDSTIHFCVVATNLAHPYLSSSIRVALEIDDVNDNPPIIVFPKSDYILEVSSWTEVNDVVLKIFAEDADRNESNSLLTFYKLSYGDDNDDDDNNDNNDVTMVNYKNVNRDDNVVNDHSKSIDNKFNANDFFTIEQNTGDIRLIRFLRDTDYWNDTTFTFAFSVNDSGNPSFKTDSSFTIHILADDDFKLRDYRRQTNFSKFVNSHKNLLLLLILCSSTFLLMTILTITICYTKWRMKKSGNASSDPKINIPPPAAVYLVNVVEKEKLDSDPTDGKKKLESFEHSPYPCKRYGDNSNQLSSFSVNSQNPYECNNNCRPHYRHQVQSSPSSDSGRGQSETADVIMMMAEKNLVSKTPVLFQQSYEPRVSGLLENGIFSKRGGYEFLEAHKIAVNGSCVKNRCCIDDANLTETFI